MISGSPDIEPRFVCSACGKGGADVRPDFNRRRRSKKQRREAKGLASLMWPTKAWSGVSFACLPLRNGPNDFRCGARLALRRWRHRTSFSLRYRLGRYRKMVAPVGYPVNINKKRWRSVEISHGHGTRSMQADGIDIRQSVASLGAGQIAALVLLIAGSFDLGQSVLLVRDSFCDGGPTFLGDRRC